VIPCCPHHDPLIRAGIVHCGQCDQVAYAVDAEWVDETKLVATYPALCEHQTGGTWFVDVTRLQPLRPKRGAHGCTGRTRGGRPCGGWPVGGSDRCRWHAEAR